MKRLCPLPPPSSRSIRHSCTEQTPEQSLIYLKERCVAQYKSQVARDFCSQTDPLTPPKGVSTITSQAITVHLSALGSLPSTSALSGSELPVSTTPAIPDLGAGFGDGNVQPRWVQHKEPWSASPELQFLPCPSSVTSRTSPPHLNLSFPCVTLEGCKLHRPTQISSPPEDAAPLRRAGARRRLPRPLPLLKSARPPVSGLAPPPSGGAGAEGAEKDLPCGAGSWRMRKAGQVRGALTSWHSPLPLLAVTLYIRVTCPPGSEPPSPPLPGSSRLRHRGRCGGAPGPAAAAAPLRTRGSP